ncbi:MAG: hypothetical protein HY699_20320 [Deltaproteobacteria bacterium]|nr:hypothetical protein [Deltaproteobacteria bacterium]
MPANFHAARHATVAAIPLEALEARRDRSFRRLPALQVRSARRALGFIEEVGLASLFAARSLNLPCLWVAVCGRRDPRFPQHSHHDSEVGLAWELKDQLPAAGKVFYGKLIRKKPTFVAWDIFPAVYRLFGPEQDYLRAYRDGLLSAAAKAVLDSLDRDGPQDTFALKLASNLARPRQRRVFDAAMAELQQRLYVSMREVRYDPFTYVWDLVARRYGERVAPARRLGLEAAAVALARRYLQAVVYASFNDLAGVLASRQLATRAVASLQHEGVVRSDCRIEGLGGKWLVASPTSRHGS